MPVNASGPLEPAQAIARHRKIGRLLVDRLAYWVVSKIVKRTAKTGIFTSPLVVPVSDLIGQRIISTGCFELTQFDAVDQLFSEPLSLVGLVPDLNGVFIDVGANIGLYTTRYAPLFRRTVAIEANPATFFVLKANVTMARSPNTEALCIGASNKAGTAQLKVAEAGWLGVSKLGQDPGWPTYSVDIETDTLENITREIRKDSRVAVLKIDVEGHELEVLQGAADMINSDGPVILFEALSGEAGLSTVKLLQTLKYNYFFTFSRKITLRALVSGLPVIANRVDPDNPSEDAMICAMRSPTHH
jgi:FkbM family methyltransferase